MWTLIESKVRPLTKTLAQTFATMEPAPNDRPLSDRRLQVYRKQLSEGSWRPCQWAKAICAETGITYRINGKHTSTMFAGMDAIPPDLFVTVESYDCPDLNDVARLYGTFDSSIASRKNSDINRTFAASIPELANLPRRIIDSSVTGIQLYKCGGDTSSVARIPAVSRAENLISEAAFVLWVDSIIRDTTKFNYLARSGVVAAMFATYKKSQRDASEFWSAVRDETGARPTTPDRMLGKYLSTTKTHSGNANPTPRSRLASTREIFVKSLHCWNAWRRQEEMKTIKYFSAGKIPAAA